MSNNTTCTTALLGTNVSTQVIRNRPFIAPEAPIGDSRDPFERCTIETQLQQRLSNSSFPDQKFTSLCGPAAFFYCLQVKHPAFYRMAVQQLWALGEADIAHLRIRPTNACKRPENYFYDTGEPRIKGIDWITLAGLRSSSNLNINGRGFSYDSPDETTFEGWMANKLLAITTPPQLQSWFTLSGFKKVEGFIINPFNAVKSFIKINEYYKTNHCIVALVDSNLLGSLAKVRALPTHWVVWTSMLTDKNGNSITSSVKNSDVVKLTVFSWGEDKNVIYPNITFSQFQKHTFQCLVFK